MHEGVSPGGPLEFAAFYMLISPCLHYNCASLTEMIMVPLRGSNGDD